MNTDKFKRVLWRLQSQAPAYPEKQLYSFRQVRRAIMEEVGCDPRTIKSTIHYMRLLDMMKRLNFQQFSIMIYR